MNRLWVGVVVVVATMPPVRADDTEAKAMKRLFDISAKGDVVVKFAHDDSQPDRPVVGLELSFHSGGGAEKELRDVSDFLHLRRIEIYCVKLTEGAVKELAKVKGLADISFVQSDLTPEGLKALARCKKLTTLRMYRCGFGEGGLKALAELKNVTHLSLSAEGQDHPITDDWLKSLAAMENLTHLELFGGSITSVGLTHLTGYKKLTKLNLRQTPLKDSALNELASLKNLTALDISHTDLSGRGMKQLAALSNLTELRVGGLEGLNDEEFKALAPLTKLTTLELCTGVTDAGLKHLTSFPDLTALDLSATKVTDAGLKNLAPLKKLNLLVLGVYPERTLKTLAEFDLLHTLPFATGKNGARPASAAGVVRVKLKDNERQEVDGMVSGKWLKYLAAFKSLAELDLSETASTDAEMKQVAAFTSLRELNLARTKVTDVGLKELATLKNLTALNLDETAVTPAGVKESMAFKNLARFQMWVWVGQVDDAPVEDLAALRTLTHLTLYGEGITDTGLKAVAGLPELAALHLVSTRVKAGGLKQLAACKKLSTLSLTQARGVGQAELDALAALTTLRDLTVLTHTREVSKGDADKLREALPLCRVEAR